MSDGRTDGTVLFAFLAGAIIGAGVGLLLAPQSGSETRKQIGDLAHKAQEKANEMAHKAQEKAGELKEKVARKVEHGAERVRDAVSA